MVLIYTVWILSMISLLLYSSPDLTWRDVQYLVVETSSHDNLNHSTSLSGAGRKGKYSQIYIIIYSSLAP